MMELEKLPPIHPGEILSEEFLKPLKMSQHELAKSLGMDAQRIHAIIAGEESVTAETALRLSRFFGTSAGLWTGIQSQYDVEVAKDRLAAELRAIKPRHWTSETELDIELSLPRACACGCGDIPEEGSRFLQGHDHKAVHKVIKKEYGSVMEFLRHHDYPFEIALTRRAAEE